MSPLQPDKAGTFVTREMAVASSRYFSWSSTESASGRYFTSLGSHMGSSLQNKYVLTLFTVCCSYTVNCILNSVYCTLYTAYITLYT